MKDFIELVQEEYVSKCGRWLKKPRKTTDIWMVDPHGSIVHFNIQYNVKEMPSIKYGNAFYSKEHAELARDTMEAEQIVRKWSYSIYDFYYYRLDCGDNFDKLFMDPKMKNELEDRFGAERLQEILSQELKE